MGSHTNRSSLGRLAKAAAALLVFLALGAFGGGAALRLGPNGEILPLPLSALRGSLFAGSRWKSRLSGTAMSRQLQPFYSCTASC